MTISSESDIHESRRYWKAQVASTLMIGTLDVVIIYYVPYLVLALFMVVVIAPFFGRKLFRQMMGYTD